ncbi:hypothetical protein KIW84_066165 [Lathyrus oleraceus]|uniref:Uncharacterized protein n=1 Tax=Pisum sativum TaxID=3888 RepID=A0A9D4WHH0_PEA|nr:hypothetical protein KIW84_066165 [Pisum sativum]
MSTGYTSKTFVPVVLEGTEPVSIEARMENNARRSKGQNGFPARLKDCELFQDNVINDDGDPVHFALMDEYKPIKMEEALNDPKWICSIKEELESIKFYKSKKGLLIHQISQ